MGLERWYSEDADRVNAMCEEARRMGVTTSSVANAWTDEAREAAAASRWRNRTKPAPAPKPSTVGDVPQAHVEAVVSAVRSAGPHNFALLTHVRDHLDRAGITDPVHQDRAIQKARVDGRVSASNFEGRHGASKDDLAAGLRDSTHREGEYFGSLTERR